MNPFAPLPSTIELGINIDHVATLRNVRGTVYPSPIEAALQAEQAGADVITLHLREDRRHIRDHDVRELRPLLNTRMNLEAAVTEEMLAFACVIQPSDVCLVPERRNEVTTEGGLNVIDQFTAVKAAVQRLHDAGIRVSLFIDADSEQIDAAAQTGARVIELHTGRYADTQGEAQAQELQRLTNAVQTGLRAGLRVNAGHGLNIDNVQPVAALAGIAELNIGHAIVARAVFIGWQAAIREMKALMVSARKNTAS